MTEPVSAYADMSRAVQNRSRSWDVYDPTGNHIATVRTKDEADALLKEVQERNENT